MRKLTATTAETPEALLNDLRALVSDAELMLNDSPGEDGRETLATLRGRFDSAQRRLTDFYTAARNRLTAGVKYTDEAIRTHPYQALAIAAGIGLLGGVLLGRRSR